MGQTILTTEQRRVLDAVMVDERFASYYLAGGTALSAFHLHHRVSDDLDFFTDADQDAPTLHAFIDTMKTNFQASDVRYVRIHDRYLFTFMFGSSELKVEFTRYPFPRIAPIETYDGVRVDNLRDIAANKLMALLDRFEPKDFVDLYFLLQRYSLADVRRDAETKFGVRIDNIFLGGELAKVRRIEVLPKMIEPLTIADLKAFFSDRARELKQSVLSE